MRRRAFLAAAGGTLLTLCGCLGSNGSDTTPPAPSHTTEQPTSTTTVAAQSGTDLGTETPSSDGTDPTTTTTPVPLTVSVEMIRPGLVRMNSPDSTAVRGTTDDQYLVLDVTVPESLPASDAPAEEEFRLQFDGREHPAMDLDRGFTLWRARGREWAYSDGGGALVFELPDAGNAGDATLVWPGGEWDLPGETRRRLAAPTPSPSASVAVSEAVAVGEAPTLTFEITNEGGREAWFVAAIDRVGPSVAHVPAEQLSVPVPAGETVIKRVTDSFYGYPSGEAVSDGEPDATYHIDWVGGEAERHVRVVEE